MMTGSPDWSSYRLPRHLPGSSSENVMSKHHFFTFSGPVRRFQTLIPGRLSSIFLGSKMQRVCQNRSGSKDHRDPKKTQKIKSSKLTHLLF